MRRAVSISILFILILNGIIIFQFSEEGVDAAVLHVGPGQTYSKIEDAIAIANNGDTVRVHPGIYRETVDISKSINLIGNGSEEVFIINENVWGSIGISASNVVVEGISIYNVNDFQYSYAIGMTSPRNVTIRNCSIINSYNGVYVEDPGTGTIGNVNIYNNNFSGNTYGIFLWKNDLTWVHENSFQTNGAGIFVAYSNSERILNNTFTDGGGIYSLNSNDNNYINNNFFNASGFYLELSDYETIENNTISDFYGVGINNHQSTGSKIFNNTIKWPKHQSNFGIQLDGEKNLKIVGNSLIGCGFFSQYLGISEWGSWYFSNNTVNGRNLVCEVGKSNVAIPAGAGQVILINCNKVTVSNQNLSNASAGIYSLGSTELTIGHCNLSNNTFGFVAFNFISKTYQYNIHNNSFNDCEGGLLFYTEIGKHDSILIDNNSFRRCNFGIGVTQGEAFTGISLTHRISNNLFEDMTEDGISIYNRGRNVITNNRFINSGVSISLRGVGSSGRSVVNDIDTNSIEGCSLGIKTYYVDLSNIHNNTIRNATGNGMDISKGADLELNDNRIEDCGDSGISLSEVTQSNIDRNTINRSGTFGLRIYRSTNDLFRDNIFNECGMYFPDGLLTPNTITGNKVNGRDLITRLNVNDLDLSSNVGQVILKDCDRATIKNQNLSGSSVGIQLVSCDDTVIEECSSSDNYMGLDARDSDNLRMENTTIANSTYRACNTDKCDFMFVANCTFEEAVGARGVDKKFLLASAINTTMKDNNFTSCGILLDSSRTDLLHLSNHVFKNNTVNGRDLVYLDGVVDQNINGTAGQVILVDSTNITVQNNNLSYTAMGVFAAFSTGLKILNNTCDNNDKGVDIFSLFSTVANCIISNNSCLNSINGGIGIFSTINQRAHHNMIQNNLCNNNGQTGIAITYAGENNTISDNQCNNNDDYGIALTNAGDNNTISNNDCIDAGKEGVEAYGLDTDRSVNLLIEGNKMKGINKGIDLRYTDELVIKDNTIFESEYGIYLQDSGTPIIDDNMVKDCQNDGIHISIVGRFQITNNSLLNNGGHGIYTRLGDSGTVKTISYNLIQNNGKDGLHLKSRTYDVFNNTFISNKGYGIYNDEDGNSFTSNIFIDNKQGWIQAYDVGYSTKWDNGTHGNLWMDHQSPDANSDNIVDIPYQLDGHGKSADRYPLVLYWNLEPIITTVDIRSAFEDASYEVRYKAEDPNIHDILNWSCNTNANFFEMNSTSGNLTGDPTNDDVGIWWVNISVSDGNGGTDWSNFTLEVINVNDPPNITTEDFEDAFENAPYYIEYEAVDIDPTDDELVWNLSTDADFLKIDPMNGTLEGNPTMDDIGIYFVNVSVVDGKGGEDWTNFTLEVHNVNDDPVITTGDITVAIEDIPYSMDYDAFDIDPTGDVLTWTLTTDAGFLSIADETGTLSGLPTNSDVGTYWVNVSVGDGLGGADWSNFTLEVENINDDPIIETVSLLNATEDQEYNLTIEVMDVDPTDDTLLFNLTTNADFLTIDPHAGILSGTPLNDDVGQWWIDISVNDGQGGIDSINLTLMVANINDPPIIITKELPDAVEDHLYITLIRAVDPDPTDDILTWEIVNTNVHTFTITETTGALIGSPIQDDVGIRWIEIEVSDGNGGITTANFTVIINGTNDKPEIIDPNFSIILNEDDTDTEFDLHDLFVDAEGDQMNFTHDQGENISIDLVGSIVKVVPFENWNGMEKIVFTASDGEFNVSIIVGIRVLEVPDAPYDVSISGGAQFVEGGAQWVSGSALDHDVLDKNMLTFIWSSNVTGRIGEGPEINLSLTAGKHLITLNVTDQYGLSATATLEIEITKEEADAVSRESNDSWLWLIVLLIIIVLLAISVAIVVIFRNRVYYGDREE
jgi:parallel beta-helix repeat protein